MNNAFYNNKRFRNSDTKTEFKERFRTTEALIENLYLQAIVEAYGRIKLGKGVEKLKENDIRNLFIADFKYQNTLLKSYIENKVITFTAENQSYTQNLNQRTDIEFHSNLQDRKSTRLNSSHRNTSRMPSSA